MRKYLYVACDGGMLNTLGGSGGILQIPLNGNGEKPYYHEFPYGMGGSPHFVKQSPNKRHLVLSCSNTAQIYVFPLKADHSGYDLENPRIINNFSNLGMTSGGPESTTDFFDFWGDNDTPGDGNHIVTHFNLRLIKVNLLTGEMKVLHNFSYFGPNEWNGTSEKRLKPEPPKYLHQVTTKGDYIIVDDALAKCIFVFKKTGIDTVELLYQAGDGYRSGHHCEYIDPLGRLTIARPSFNFMSFGNAFKIQDNVLSLYTLGESKPLNIKTFHYALFIANHAPVDTFVDYPYFYGAYGVPGSVMKINLHTGAIEKQTRIELPPFWKRWLYFLADYRSWQISHGTGMKGFDRPQMDIHQHYLASFIATEAGTRGGFFTLAPDPVERIIYACHRGLNRMYVLDKDTLKVLDKRQLPLRSPSRELFSKFLYRRSKYLSRGLGTHHGKVAILPDPLHEDTPKANIPRPSE